MKMQIDISFDHDTSFKNHVFEPKCKMWVTAYTKNAQKVIKGYGIKVDIRKPILLDYDEWNKIWKELRYSKLMGLYGGYHYNDDGTEIL